VKDAAVRNLFQQLPTLVAVAVGAIASYLATTATERARWRREKTTRWDDRRMETYAAYGHAIKAHTQLASWVCAFRGLGSVAQPLPLDEGLRRLADAEETRATLWEQVLLLGEPGTIVAARRWHEATWRFEVLARGIGDGKRDYQELMAETNEARGNFYEHARADLGVTGGAPMEPWPRRRLEAELGPNEAHIVSAVQEPSTANDPAG
jgi:hypothetical protein